ncbi:UDP-N-acetylmuramate--L-alanine ligase [Pedobacter sp. HMF7647]|uniref:UDP-N-acetylmuramate--L-alanine ligase n=1 Tax=Hufsiella arboris TaxID=2695275 RepID=A0A7K1YDU4_9SPHI|nr:UDP-N-acetylmuramate--L-alanine ligase [Hufsiella arboris]MXV52777.1 UDP-N-acetylmuramate--L-alanine ligase [Hufsiella arboris]
MKLDNIEKVYLIGIGGIGMSGLARYFKNRGCFVAGYDRTATPLTDRLIDEGMDISFVDSAKSIPDAFKIADNERVLIIYTPAIPGSSPILNHFKNAGFDLKKRSQVLGIISEGMFTIAVAGTHGKTTTSSMVAHLLRSNGNDCTAFLGGIAANYKTNFLIGSNNVMVVEADEYDRSFLTLHPDIAIVTSMDADHLDIYGDVNHLEESFKLFVSQIKEDGDLINHSSLPLVNGLTYSSEGNADIKAKNIRIENGSFYFDFVSNGVLIENIHIGLPGIHNIENATAAIQAALFLKIEPAGIKEALGSFKGVNRRFEYIVKTDKHIYIDDYAHHPEELRACITAVKSLYPDKKLTTIFQPHLFSRTRDFVGGFAEVLAMTDELILLDIYPARELPIEGVTSEMLLNKINLADKSLQSKEGVLEYVRDARPELLLTVGAGDIDTLVKPLRDILNHA